MNGEIARTATLAGPIDLDEAATGDWRLYGSGISRTTTAVESLLVRACGDGMRVLEVHLPGGERRDFAMPAAVRRHLAALLLDDGAVRVRADAVTDVLAERQRQVEVEGYDAAHDARYRPWELAVAGACYAMTPSVRACVEGNAHVPAFWPWERQHWKPRGDREDLVRAGALIIAAIERLDREAAGATLGTGDVA